MHNQLQQSVFLLRNIKIEGICTTFHSKKSKNTETKTSGAVSRRSSYLNPCTRPRLWYLSCFY